MGLQCEEMGKRISQRRKELKLRQNQLAEQLEISNNHLSSIETGKAVPSLPLFAEICSALRVTPDYLMEGAMHSDNVPQNILETLRLCSREDIELAEQFVKLLVRRTKAKRAAESEKM